jgi:hypothetical protein
MSLLYARETQNSQPFDRDFDAFFLNSFLAENELTPPVVLAFRECWQVGGTRSV